MSGNRKAILHIGTEKTGTTSIQHFLATNRSLLNESGFHYPKFPESENHLALVGYSNTEAALSGLISSKYNLRSRGDVISFKSNVEAWLEREINNYSNYTYVFSSEHMHSVLTEEKHILELKRLLSEWFSKINIIVYLRRQDRTATSYYSTHIKGGGFRQSILPDQSFESYYNYFRLLERWGSVFGDGNIFPYIYENDKLINNSVLYDFMHRCGIDISASEAEKRNSSLSPVGVDILRLINEYLINKEDKNILSQRHRLVPRMEAIAPGKGVYPSRSEARNFYRKFYQSNCDLGRKWFGVSASPFSEDFSIYPSKKPSRTYSNVDVAHIMAELWTKSVSNELKEQIEKCYWRAKFLEKEGELEKAESDYMFVFDQKCKFAKDAAIRLAELYERRDQYNESSCIWKQAISFINDSEVMYRYGRSLRINGQLSAAASILQCAIEMNFSKAPAHRALALTYEALGELACAEQKLQDTIDVGPGDRLGTGLDYIRVLIKQDKTCEAREELRNLKNMFPKNARIPNDVEDIMRDSQ